MHSVPLWPRAQKNLGLRRADRITSIDEARQKVSRLFRASRGFKALGCCSCCLVGEFKSSSLFRNHSFHVLVVKSFRGLKAEPCNT